MPKHVHTHYHQHYHGMGQQQGEQILELLKEIKTLDQKTLDLLTNLDAVTTKIGTNIGTIATGVSTIGTAASTIGTELQALIDAQKSAGTTPPDVLAALQTQANKAQAVSDASDAAVSALNIQIPILQGIAANGQPVVPPAPPAPAPITVAP